MKIQCKCPSSCAAAASAFWVSATVSAIACKLFCAILTFEFALVGTALGAYCGARVGLNSMSSLLHGAIMGAFFPLKFLENHLFFGILMIGQLVLHSFRKLKTDSIILNERIERLSSHSTVCRNGKSMQKIPNKRFTGKNIVDTLWNGPTCSICLQDFQKGEMVCSLPTVPSHIPSKLYWSVVYWTQFLPVVQENAFYA
ncbi:hypothetical protein NC651_004889 [Populus alba x Populus x berolinensis]|nr:hypothetical protein NC651_004889 [Populus alba x Populus x berolinensis]